jgi:hypothetical protein
VFILVACNRLGGVRPPARKSGVVTEAPGSTSIRDGQDVAVRALERLLTELATCTAELDRARVRGQELLAERRRGLPWLDIVLAEHRPLVVESISTVLASLARAGHEWRREQASALRDEQVSINRIAALFGVTRQRISALLRERSGTEGSTG